MPDIGFYHPIVIHFAIGLLAIGVLFRWMARTGHADFAGPAAVCHSEPGRVVEEGPAR